MPQKYTKKPVTIEAAEWDGTAAGAAIIIEWVLAGGGTARYACAGIEECDSDPSSHWVEIDTLEGVMRVSPRDMVICGVQGEFYPCKPDIFAETYDEAEA